MIIGRRLAATLSGVFAALIVGATAAPAAAEPRPSQDPPKVQLVLDVSGSMGESYSAGQTRMDAAKQAFNEVIDGLPETVHLGIRTLGANFRGEEMTDEACRDSEQIYPVGRVAKAEAKEAVAALEPTGFTPISHALREAVADFGGESDNSRRIVLITDGEETCGPPDPCEVARELAAEGIRLTVDTLGLTPKDDKVRTQLGCIAEATGGTYTAVQDVDQLTERLGQLVDRSAEVVVEAPAVVEGASDDCAAAPLLRAGVYSDREEIGEHRFYRVQLAPGRELRASVSVAADRPVDRDYAVMLRLLDEDGQELARGREAGHGRTDVISTGLRYPWAERAALPDADADAGSAASPSPDANGDGSGDGEESVLCLEVSNAFSAPDSVQRAPGMPVELTVDLVAAADSPSDVAAFGLARGWVPLVLLTVTGLVAGVVWGLVRRVFA
ncbi:VWA domain-containing protein [Streptomyces bohaiensis]|uniref:VWA domain-containing protein n=1 Tax=Streptomyces bohaiensis TaxID=1431344 RepID=A0ABX1C5W6_9ACTN|nr:VWA domain-containing protein [Streptomyces bohaiensis]NJQ14581.1 VWA domain-containing protein [Streptomyces bohaiensis]